MVEVEDNIHFEWVDRCDSGDRLISSILNRGSDDLQGKLIILPTERMVQEAKFKISQNGGGFTGSIMTLRKLPRYMYDILKGSQPVIDLTTREMIIQKVMEGSNLRSLVREGDVRAGMVKNISTTIGELISHDISFMKLQKEARTGRSRELGTIYKGYKSQLRERGMVDPDSLPLTTLGILKESELSFERIGIYLLGDMAGSELELIQELMRRSKEVIVHEHPSRVPPSFLEGEVPDRPEMELSIPLPGERALSTLTMSGSIPSLWGADTLDEIRNIFRHIKERCIRENLDPSDLRIVFPVRQTVDDLVRMVSDEYDIPIDQGEDLPLEKAPIISSIISSLKVGEEGLRRKEIVEVLSSPFLTIKDPNNDEINGNEIEMVTRAASMGPSRRTPDDWSRILKKVKEDPTIAEHIKLSAERMETSLPELVSSLETIIRSTGPVGPLINSIMDIMDHLGVTDNLENVITRGEEVAGSEKGEGPYQFNVTALHKFYQVLRSIDKRSRILGIEQIKFKDLLKFIEIEISKMNVRSVPRVPGIQIMGLTEAAGLDMTNTYYACLVEGMIPAVENGYRILTEMERKNIGITEKDHKREQLENLAIALGSTTDPVLSYHLNTGDRQVSISSFIESLELDPVIMDNDPRSRSELLKAIGNLMDPASRSYREGKEVHSIPELLFHTVEDSKIVERGLRSFRRRKDADSNEFSGRIIDDDLISLIRDRFDDEHTWSVTQFETFRNCPYLFYIRYLLGIQELEDLEPGIPPEKKGLIFHEVVERFYDEFRRKHGDRVTKENLHTASRIIRSIGLDVISSHPNEGPYWDALKDQFIGSDKEKGLLDCFLEIEADYSGPFVVEGTELKFGLKGGHSPAVRISLPGDEDGPDSFKLKGSIDRIDILRTRSGDLDFIWDYKTGSSDVDKESVQVPLYLATVRKIFPDHYPAGGGYYYVRKRGAINRAPVDGEDIWNGELKDKDELQTRVTTIGERIQDSIERCLEMRDAIRSGDMSPQHRCKDRYCKFLHLCRRGDQK